ncbi:SH3 domain-containing protein (plasmid) [Alkalihalobacillus hwajinpoensis]|uniref:SH3 domain-containing protein n=1 Tax=Guptibacillus hwajinpoensis TaxID=208199 RepID=UPI001883DADA|nr:SH3 domain-containing protein [Pseudalkalibacillus hwajinpoensis]MBF0706609.1 SH3 domain-containing protein [Pseudalkalibacillus hwajinpoensis]
MNINLSYSDQEIARVIRQTVKQIESFRELRPMIIEANRKYNNTIREMAKVTTVVLSDIRKSMISYRPALHQILLTVAEQANTLRSITQSIDFEALNAFIDSVDIESDIGYLDDGELREISGEIELEISRITEEENMESVSAFPNLINKIVYWATDSSAGKKHLVINLILSLIVSVASGQITIAINSSDNVSSKEKILVAERVVEDMTIPTYFKMQHRLVIKDNLYVRSNKKKQSNIVDVLNIGNIVRIIEKNRNWTFVEYENGDGELERGWVNTRYIKQIR